MNKKILGTIGVIAIGGITIASFSSPTLAQSTCQPVNVNFAGISHGETISSQYSSYGISISGQGYGAPNKIIAFDTTKTGTPDPDLEVNQGIVAIIPDNVNDGNNDGIIDIPNDNARGGKQTYTFNTDREVKTLTFIDKDDSKIGTIKSFDASNTLLNTTNIPSKGDGSVQTLQVNTDGVRKVEVEYRGSGGIGSINLGCSTEPGNENSNENTNANENTNTNGNTNSNENNNENEPGTDIPEVSYPVLFAIIGGSIIVGLVIGLTLSEHKKNQ